LRTDSGRWTEVTQSRVPHERDGLEHVRAEPPNASPYHAWSNLEFPWVGGRWCDHSSLDGSPYEVDLVVLGPAGFHLVELKAWSAKITGDEFEWQEHRPWGGRPIPRPNPL